MEYIDLGKTDLRISPIGMGTIQITRLPWKESIRVVQDVCDLGVNWFDTAQGYLDSELRLGEAFQGMRDRVVIITKSGSKDTKTLTEHVHASLKRLQTDYIDVLFFHGGSAVDEKTFALSGGLLEAAEGFIREGKVRYLGFSAHRPEVALRALDYSKFVVSMVPANYINREYIDSEFMDKARRGKVAVIAMKPVGGGRIQSVGPSIRFLKTYGDLIPCIGIERASEMEENIRCWEDERGFSEEDRAILEDEKALLGDKFCRLCGYCLPCPEDIPIPTVNFLKVFSKQMPRDRVVTPDHADAVEKAANCTECRQCVDKCPYDLEIPDMLRENIEFYKQFAENG